MPSSALQSADWQNSTVLRGPLADEIPAIKSRHAGDVLLAGSGQLVRGLLVHGLVDELRLIVFPIILGSGKRPLPEGTAAARLRLLESRSVGSDGVRIMSYASSSNFTRRSGRDP